MQQSSIAIAAAAVVGLAALVYLWVKVGEEPEPVEASEISTPAPKKPRKSPEPRRTDRAKDDKRSEGGIKIPSRSRTERSAPSIPAPRTDRSRPTLRGNGDDGDGDVTLMPSKEEAFEKRLDSVNALYNRGNYIDAKSGALAVLADHPTNVRMIRVVVSSACILGEADEAEEWYGKLPRFDKRQMKTRCKRYQVEFSH